MTGDYLANVVECECCHERWCLVHDEHWAFSPRPGPHDDDDDDGEEPWPQEPLTRCDSPGRLMGRNRRSRMSNKLQLDPIPEWAQGWPEWRGPGVPVIAVEIWARTSKAADLAEMASLLEALVLVPCPVVTFAHVRRTWRLKEHAEALRSVSSWWAKAKGENQIPLGAYQRRSMVADAFKDDWLTVTPLLWRLALERGGAGAREALRVARLEGEIGSACHG